jgi:copper chaperone CopZ
MIKTTVKIDGMMCGMCEAHINDSIRNNFAIKKVTSSHSKKQSVIISQDEIDENKLREVIDKTGYKFISSTSQTYEKKGLLSLFK